MPTATPPDRLEKADSDDEIPLLRLSWWTVLAGIIAIGIYFYFHFEGQMSPLLG